jgi:hypothetical protein
MIKTFIGLLQAGKKSIKPNYSWSEELEKITRLPEEIQRVNKGGLVSEETTREEFKNRFHYLSIARFLCALALAFSVSKIFADQPLFGILCAALGSVIFTIILVQYSYKSWVCQYIWDKWPSRMSLRKPRFGKFLMEIVTRPSVLFVFKL